MILLKRLIIVSLVLLIPVLISAQKKPEPWPVPEEYRNMTNPVPKNDASIKEGQGLYTKYCASCHGKTGLGDGVKSRALQTYSGDFSSQEYQNQTDGEHFFKTKFGRGEMPKYEGRLQDEDIWKIIHYMRTFKK